MRVEKTSVRRRGTSLLTLVLVAAVGACSDSVSPPDTVPPGPVTSLEATVSGGSVQLSWKEPTDPDLAGALVARFPATGPNANPVAGHSYTVGEALGSGQAVFVGRDTKATDAPPCRQHVYAVWAEDRSGNWSAQPQTLSVSGLPGQALPAAPTALRAQIDTGTVALSWTNSGSPASLRVVRKQGSPPTSASDGQVVFSGSGTAARDIVPALVPQVASYYGVFACNPCGDCESMGAKASVTPTLMEALRAGGYVLFWRHATANTCTDKQSLGTAAQAQIMDWWKSCERNCSTALARQLDSPQGYDEAETVGNALRARKIPFARVYSSEYCRALETAQRMGLGPIPETLKELTFFVYPELTPTPSNGCLASLLGTVPSAGRNVALVAHTFLGCNDGIASAEAWIYRPDGRGGSALIAKVKASEWASLP